MHVVESELSKEFLKARSNQWDWEEYKYNQRRRHEWGIYLCSNLDWDWDVAGCLERLFDLPEEVTPTTALITTVSLEAGKADRWNIFTETRLPTEMKIAYKTATGETKYKTIMICPSTDHVASAGDSSNVVGGHHKPGHPGEEETEDEAEVNTDECGDSESEPEAELELGVKQVVEKQEVVSLIPEEPSCGVRVEDRDGSDAVAHKNSDAPRMQGVDLGPTDSGCGDGSTTDTGLQDWMHVLAATKEEHVDQISICSLD